jgi:WhiB family transcriptional regulator, redox-sensing transcriptional regulator
VSTPFDDYPEDRAWMIDAACRALPIDVRARAEMFHPSRGDDHSAAKAVCAGCPVRQTCLDWALDHHEDHGMWGGMTERARRRYRNERRMAVAS